jgi:hypothetical protein
LLRILNYCPPAEGNIGMPQERCLTKANIMRTKQLLEVGGGGFTFLFSSELPCTNMRYIYLAVDTSVAVV